MAVEFDIERNDWRAMLDILRVNNFWKGKNSSPVLHNIEVWKIICVFCFTFDNLVLIQILSFFGRKYKLKNIVFFVTIRHANQKMYLVQFISKTKQMYNETELLISRFTF